MKDVEPTSMVSQTFSCEEKVDRSFQKIQALARLSQNKTQGKSCALCFNQTTDLLVLRDDYSSVFA
jgi:hypothetical protein